MTTFDIDGRFIHMKQATVIVSQYADGTVALIAEDTDSDGFPNRETLSVNLTGYGLYPPDPDTIFVPSWSENEGLPEALDAAGIAVPVDQAHFGPFATTAVLMRLTEAVMSGD